MRCLQAEKCCLVKRGGATSGRGPAAASGATLIPRPQGTPPSYCHSAPGLVPQHLSSERGWSPPPTRAATVLSRRNMR